ncbi:uncharacterized protein LOC142577983 [Dermacentor variabilis]|uniref:uncharacterized protein LOC142577983 n=1 Tax=Dermacentor variabilis TaxID=34621 RepID=UPI003F5AE063
MTNEKKNEKKRSSAHALSDHLAWPRTPPQATSRRRTSSDMDGKKQGADESKSTRHSKKPKQSPKQGQKVQASTDHSAVAKEAPRKKKKAAEPKRPESEVMSSTLGALSATDAHPPETTERSGTGIVVGIKTHRYQSRGQKGNEARDVAPERGGGHDGDGGQHGKRSAVSRKLPQAKSATATLGNSVSPGISSHPSSPDHPRAVAPEGQEGQPPSPPPPAESCRTENVGPDHASSKRRPPAELRKSSLAHLTSEKLLSEIMGEAGLSSEANAVVVSVLPVAEPAHDLAPRLSESRPSITNEGSTGLGLGRKSIQSERNLDITARSAHRRSQLWKPNEAVTVRAAMDRRSSTVLPIP